MSIYAIGDLHLSLSCEKPMDIFSGWINYVAKIEENWKAKILDTDTVVVCGDISWGMSLEQSLEDFKFINSLPGKKIILKGNHDYWWTSVTKMEKFFSDNGLTTLKILHNNSYVVENIAICGSRGWIFENGQAFDQKIINREVQRISTSLLSAPQGVEKIAFLHYPPVFKEDISEDIVKLLQDAEVKICCYGHIHGAGHRYAIDGMYLGIDFRLIAADYIGFNPQIIR